MNNRYRFVNGKVLVDTDSGELVLDYSKNIVEILAKENIVETIETYLERCDEDLDEIDVAKTNMQIRGIVGMFMLLGLDLGSMFTKYAPKRLEDLVALFAIELGAVLGFSSLEYFECLGKRAVIDKKIVLLESAKGDILSDIDRLKKEKDDGLDLGQIPNMESRQVYYEGMLTNVLKWCEIDDRKERKIKLKKKSR